MTRLLPLLAATCATALLAAGCTSDKPSPNYSSITPTASTSTSLTLTESPSPTGVPTTGPNVNPGEVAPTKPAAASGSDQDAALAFVAYYVRMSDWVFATSETAILDPFFAPGCTTCLQGQQYLSGLLAGGAHFKGGRITVDRLQIVQNDGRQGADFAITSVTNVEAAQVVAADGSITKSFPASTSFQLTDWVKFVDGTWLIVEERKV